VYYKQFHNPGYEGSSSAATASEDRTAAMFVFWFQQNKIFEGEISTSGMLFITTSLQESDLW
jgi:hypothetical protein